MRRFGREGDLEKLNRDAITIAKKVANKYGKLVAGGLSNTPLYKKNDTVAHQKIYEMFKVRRTYLSWLCFHVSFFTVLVIFDFKWRS